MDFIHQETGWGNPLRPRCEFEDLYILTEEVQEDKSIVITIKYNFDEDGFSMYDKTHTLQGTFTITSDEKISEWFLEETETGVAAVRDPYTMHSKKE